MPSRVKGSEREWPAVAAALPRSMSNHAATLANAVQTRYDRSVFFAGVRSRTGRPIGSSRIQGRNNASKKSTRPQIGGPRQR